VLVRETRQRKREYSCRSTIGCPLGRSAEYLNQSGGAVDPQQVASANAAGTSAGMKCIMNLCATIIAIIGAMPDQTAT
jgi:hypothetical protein